jgi:hypothetical protein
MSDDDTMMDIVPEYRFEWDDGTERTTEDLPENPEGRETLALLGREDPSCEVTLIGAS